VLAVVNQNALIALKGDFDLVVANVLADKPNAKFWMAQHFRLFEILADGIGPGWLFAFRQYLFVGRFGLLLFLTDCGFWGRTLLFLTLWPTIAVRIAARVALNATNLVLVFGDHYMRSVRLALLAVGFELGAHLVRFVVEDEVLHTLAL